MKIKLILLFAIFSFCATSLYAETDELSWLEANGIEFRLQAGYNIGAASPMPFPPEIRELQGYNPGFNLSLDVVTIKWFTPSLGIGLDLRMQNQGMKTDARVKSYKMKMTEGDSVIAGYWTGSVVTNVLQNLLGFSVPVLWKPAPAWELQLGPFFTWRVGGQFSGHVYDGYLREGDPTGNKIVFEGDAKGLYDFSDELNIFNWGIEIAGMWQPFEHFSVRAGLTWGFRSILDKEFETISFPMYPVFATIGFVYIF